MSHEEDLAREREKYKRTHPFHVIFELNKKMLSVNGMDAETVFDKIDDVYVGYRYVHKINPGFYVFLRSDERAEFIYEVMEEDVFLQYIAEMKVVNALEVTKWRAGK